MLRERFSSTVCQRGRVDFMGGCCPAERRSSKTFARVLVQSGLCSSLMDVFVRVTLTDGSGLRRTRPKGLVLAACFVVSLPWLAVWIPERVVHTEYPAPICFHSAGRPPGSMLPRSADNLSGCNSWAAVGSSAPPRNKRCCPDKIIGYGFLQHPPPHVCIRDRQP